MLWCCAKTDRDDNLEVGEDVCESGAAVTVVDMLIIAVMLSGMIAQRWRGWSWVLMTVIITMVKIMETVITIRVMRRATVFVGWW